MAVNAHEGREYVGISQVAGRSFSSRASTTSGTASSARSRTRPATCASHVLESSEGARSSRFRGTSGLSIPDTCVRFRGEPLKFGVGPEISAAFSTASGFPSTGGPPPMIEELVDVNGLPINPTSREYPASSSRRDLRHRRDEHPLAARSSRSFPDGASAQPDRRADHAAGEDRREETQFAVVFARWASSTTSRATSSRTSRTRACSRRSSSSSISPTIRPSSAS